MMLTVPGVTTSVPESENVGESGEDSEDEWNYYRVEPTAEGKQQAAQPVCIKCFTVSRWENVTKINGSVSVLVTEHHEIWWLGPTLIYCNHKLCWSSVWSGYWQVKVSWCLVLKLLCLWEWSDMVIITVRKCNYEMSFSEVDSLNASSSLNNTPVPELVWIEVVLGT
jgi:hypothetical protein